MKNLSISDIIDSKKVPMEIKCKLTLGGTILSSLSLSKNILSAEIHLESILRPSQSQQKSSKIKVSLFKE